MVTYKEFIKDRRPAYTGNEEIPDDSKLTKKDFITDSQRATVKSYKNYARTKALKYIGHDHNDHAILKDPSGNYVRINRYGESLVHSVN